MHPFIHILSVWGKLMGSLKEKVKCIWRRQMACSVGGEMRVTPSKTNSNIYIL
jgi:hypothetical protein